MNFVYLILIQAASTFVIQSSTSEKQGFVSLGKRRGSERGGNNNPRTGDANGKNKGDGGNGSGNGNGTGDSGVQTQQSSEYDYLIFLISHSLIAVAGLILTAYASSKVPSITNRIAESVGSISLGSIFSFIILKYQTLFPLSALVEAITILSCGVLLGFLIYPKKEQVGKFGLGFLAGYIIGLLLLLVVGEKFRGELTIPIFLLICGGIIGYLVMSNNAAVYGASACVGGSFCLVYGLDSLLLKSGFSEIAETALNSRPFSGFEGTFTKLMWILFVGLLAGLLFLQKYRIRAKQ